MVSIAFAIDFWFTSTPEIILCSFASCKERLPDPQKTSRIERGLSSSTFQKSFSSNGGLREGLLDKTVR